MQPSIKITSTSNLITLKALALLTLTVLLPSILALLFTVHSQHQTIIRILNETSKEKADLNFQITRYKVAQESLLLNTREAKSAIDYLRLTTPRFRLFVFFQYYYPKMPTLTRLEYTEYLLKYGEQYSVDPLLMACIIKRESNWDPDAVGPHIPNTAKSRNFRAKGLTQVLFGWHQEKVEAAGYNTKEALFIPEVAIHAGTWAYREFLDRNSNNPYRALTAYVGGNHPTYNQNILTTYTRISQLAYQLLTTNQHDPQQLFREEFQIVTYLK